MAVHERFRRKARRISESRHSRQGRCSHRPRRDSRCKKRGPRDHDRDLEITIAGDRLVFEAKREFEEEEKKEDFVRHEMAYGRLYRAVLLPAEVEGDKAKAELRDGILEITLPKVEATTPFKVKVA
jgi:hypothetical protein